MRLHTIHRVTAAAALVVALVTLSGLHPVPRGVLRLPAIRRAPALEYRHLIEQSSFVTPERRPGHWDDALMQQRISEVLKLRESSLPHGMLQEDLKRLFIKQEAVQPLPRSSAFILEPQPSEIDLSKLMADDKRTVQITLVPLVNPFREELSASIEAPKLVDSENSSVLQRQVLKELAKKLREARSEHSTGSTLISRDNMLDYRTLARYLGKRDFWVKMASKPERFAFNMKRIQSRRISNRIELFDFSPHSTAGLKEMHLPVTDLKSWTANSTAITKLALKFRNDGIHQRSPAVDGLFHALSEQEGAVVIIYSHSDGARISLHTSTGVVQLSAEQILEQLGYWGEGAWPPAVVLLNCEASPRFVEAFLEAGSPIVFASDRKLPISQITPFLEEIFNRVQKGNDVIDAIFDSISKKGPVRMTPFSHLQVFDTCQRT